MDLIGVEAIITNFSRENIKQWQIGDRFLAGGTWLFSEPNPTIKRLYDLASLGWPSLTITDQGLEIAATCTIDTLLHKEYPPTWRATSLFNDCAHALLASWKVWHNATIGGNIANAFAAGSFTAMTAALDAQALVWKRDGMNLICTIPELIAANGKSTLEAGDLLRSIHIPHELLESDTILFKKALTPYGRSAVVVIGVLTNEFLRICITAATQQPQILVLQRDKISKVNVNTALSEINPQQYYTDAQGNAEWRQAMSQYLFHKVAEWARNHEI